MLVRNLGNIDRSLRLLIGLVALGYAFLTDVESNSMTQYISIVVGVIMIGTSAIKFCPIYRIFGLRTCSID